MSRHQGHWRQTGESERPLASWEMPAWKAGLAQQSRTAPEKPGEGSWRLRHNRDDGTWSLGPSQTPSRGRPGQKG